MIVETGTARAHLNISAHLSLDTTVTDDKVIVQWATAVWRWDRAFWVLETLTFTGRYSGQFTPDHRFPGEGHTPAHWHYNARDGRDLREILPEDIKPIAEALRPVQIGISAGGRRG